MKCPGTGYEWLKNWVKAILEWWVSTLAPYYTIALTPPTTCEPTEYLESHVPHDSGRGVYETWLECMMIFNKQLSIPCVDPLMRDGRDTRVQCHIDVPQKTSDRQIASTRLWRTIQVSEKYNKYILLQFCFILVAVSIFFFFFSTLVLNWLFERTLDDRISIFRALNVVRRKTCPIYEFLRHTHIDDKKNYFYPSFGYACSRGRYKTRGLT